MNESNDCVATFEERTQVTREEFPAPIGKLLGLMLTTEERGRAAIESEASARYTNPMGTLHGGMLCDISDAVIGVAYGSTLVNGETFTTIELKINFLRPVREAKLRAEPRGWFGPARPLAWSNATSLMNGSGWSRVLPG